MASSVNVLCPNGHRVTVKVTPTTSVLHIVEEVCKKKGFDANQFAIKSEAGKTPIDVTLQIRYANLPNNAKLELIQAVVARVSDGAKVSISLQLPDGARLKPTEFPVDASLWDIIKGFERQEGTTFDSVIRDGMEPVIVYMRDQICGEAQLRKTSLKAIGLISGRGLLRLNQREKTPAETSMDVGEPISLAASNSTAAATSATTTSGARAVDDPLAGVKLSREQMKMIDSISEGYRDYQRETEQIAGPSTSVPAPSPFAAFPGPSRDFLPTRSSPSPAASTSSPPVAVVRPQMEFADFKFPERDSSEAGGSGTNESEKRLQDNSSDPCDREMKVFNLDVIKRSESESSSMEVDDDFFDLTIDDLRSRMAELQRTASADAPLLTSAMRERREEDKYANYHRTLIRIHFPNRMILQGLFRLRETVGAIYDFVASNLDNPKTPFYLYVAPPRQDLKDKNLTMMKAGLAPAANVYIGSKNGETQLSSKCLSNLVAEGNLQSDLARLGRDSKTDCVAAKSEEMEEKDFSPPAKRPQTDAKGKATGGAGGKMPKWFAAGKKK